jgi:hypothetical protein
MFKDWLGVEFYQNEELTLKKNPKTAKFPDDDCVTKCNFKIGR